MKIPAILCRTILIAGTSMLLFGCTTKATSTRVSQPAIITASEWNSTPSEFPAEYLHTPSKVLLHHAGVTWKAGPDPAVRLKNLQSWGGREKGWFDVPYHYLIAPDGRIYEGRSVRYKPDSNTDFDTTGCINVQLWGNFEEQRVSLAQLESTIALTAWLMEKYGMERDAYLTHLDIAPGQTTCPGRDFYQYIQTGTFGGWLRTTLAGEEPVIALLEPLPDGPLEMIPTE
jgi:hypothetical protein